MPETKKDIISKLKGDILQWQGFKAPSTGSARFTGLEEVEAAFPNAVFPVGAIHEFLCEEPELAAATGGFIGGLLSGLMQNGGACLWISRSRMLFPPALAMFGVKPDQVIFIDLNREKDLLWAMEEALKCSGLAAVIGEVRDVSFAQSRRLQLAVEKSSVTGFILRNDVRKINTTTCVARWKIRALPSELADGMPGVGFPRWNVELLKVRNGNPGEFQLEWSDGRFKTIASHIAVENEIPLLSRKAG